MPHNSTHTPNSNVGLGRFDKSWKDPDYIENQKKRIAEVYANMPKKAKLPEAEFLNMAGVSEMFGVSLPDMEREIANNPKYDQSQRNVIALGNSANYSEYYKSQVPEAEKTDYNAFMQNVNRERYANIIDTNTSNARNALDITDNAIREYQIDPEKFFNKEIQTNVDISYNLPPQYANSKTRTGYDNMLGVFELVKPGGKLNKNTFGNLRTRNFYNDEELYGGVGAYEKEDIRGTTHVNPNLPGRGITQASTRDKGLSSFLVERGKTAEKAVLLAEAQVANADYNNFMNQVFGGKTLLDRPVMLPNINLTKEYIAQQTENMSFNEKRRFRSDFLNLTIKGFEAGLKGGKIPKIAQSTSVGVNKIAKVLFGESLGNQAFKDLYR